VAASSRRYISSGHTTASPEVHAVVATQPLAPTDKHADGRVVRVQQRVWDTAAAAMDAVNNACVPSATGAATSAIPATSDEDKPM